MFMMVMVDSYSIGAVLVPITCNVTCPWSVQNVE